jgi:AbrB family looped-hinge helix DNA binding protein
MTVTLKPKTEITVPKSIRRKAGIKPGDQVEFNMSCEECERLSRAELEAMRRAADAEAGLSCAPSLPRRPFVGTRTRHA